MNERMNERNGPVRIATASPFAEGAVVAGGSLPHRDAPAAAAFSMAEFDIATIPTLPNLSPVESMLGQAITGLPGLALNESREIAVTGRNAPGVATTDVAAGDLIDRDGFAGFRSFLDLAGKIRFDGSAVKWQLVGPVTLGIALERAGLDRAVAFELASARVRASLIEMSATITTALPNSPQMVIIDEPWLVELMSPGFPIPPDEAIDRMSGAMAALPPSTLTGIHCCGPCDIATLLASGPGVISVPATSHLLDYAGYLTRFLDEGGVIAWGVVSTSGPIPTKADRPWRELSDLWCELVQRGCDPVQLRRRSMVSPYCGLASHSVSVARDIARLTADVGKRVKDQSSATRFALGA
ncbi:MAG TPA: hypothetical protein VK853_06405 [Ilumatobacteraceae bacterium]|nr:hypothetical protein [Ilumatobacteraceae bacterium]